MRYRRSGTLDPDRGEVHRPLPGNDQILDVWLDQVVSAAVVDRDPGSVLDQQCFRLAAGRSPVV